MKQFEEQINFRLAKGAHASPSGLGDLCVNEAAIVAAGFAYQMVGQAEHMPPCFSRVIAEYALTLNDSMPDDERQKLKPFILRLANTADTPNVERQRAEYLAMQAVTVFVATALDAARLSAHAARCRGATTLVEAEAAARAAAFAARAEVMEPARAAVAAAVAAAGEWTVAPRAAARAAGAAAAAVAGGWGAALAALDGVLAIGKQADPLDLAIAVNRLDNAKQAAELEMEMSP